jgi:hypothetical protein
MNNPGIDLEIWNQLRKKWTELDAKGHKLEIEFKLISAPEDKNKILVIDVVQHIDGETITETVQRNAGEAYDTLGVAGLPMERLVAVYKGMIKQLHRQANQRDMDLIVTMSPTSTTSGEVRAYLKRPDNSAQNSVLVNYRHYYVLNALREKMIEVLGEAWTRVRAIYHDGGLEFYFEYS